MKIEKLKIVNYKIFREITIKMNADVNIFVGDNDAGKTTILESLVMALTGRINGGAIFKRFNLDWFNATVRSLFKQDIKEKNTPAPPSIEFEVYFACDDTDLVIKKFRGTNNSLREDCPGVKLEIAFDDLYLDVYRQLIAEEKLKDIPIEYYKVNFRTFANPEYYAQAISKKIVCINTAQRDYGPVLNKFIANTINDYLSEDDMIELRHAYRANRHEFTENTVVKTLNAKLQSTYIVNNMEISLNLKENGVDDWKDDMSISLNDIPLENMGFGTQNIFKSEMILHQNTDVDILIVEEPENNLSYANMAMLISAFENTTEKQIFISTHSSFVANKLGLQHLHLVANNKIAPFISLDEETYNYFVKLPGYNTLRILLAKHPILVEGPSDELIIQRAYFDVHGKLPIMNGVDVICVDSLAFQQYCKLAVLINKKITIVTDNDGDASKVKRRYDKYKGVVTLCIESDDKLNTLEPSVLSANMCNFEKFKSIVYKGRDIANKNVEDIKHFMLTNKTEWSFRVFMSDKKIIYPEYILKAVSADVEDV